MIISFLLVAITALTASERGSPASPPDFSGRWQVAAQETSAFRKRAHIGNHEVIVVTRTAFAERGPPGFARSSAASSLPSLLIDTRCRGQRSEQTVLP